MYLLLHLPLDPIANIRAGVAMVGLLMIVAHFVGNANEVFTQLGSMGLFRVRLRVVTCMHGQDCT